MAENDLTTVYLDTCGIPTEWVSQLAHGLVRDGLAATAEVLRRADDDNGAAVRARLHTRQRHVSAIRSRCEPVAAVRSFPLQCHDDYRTWVLDHTAA